MADKFARLLRLLQMIPRAPKSIDTTVLEGMLASEGEKMTVRTIQRDLKDLERMGFGLECIDDSKPYRYRFLETADPLMLPGLDPQAALALRLVELHMERMLPKGTLRALQPHLQAAKKALDGKPVAKWLDKVRLIPRSQQLLPPKIHGDVAGVIYEALLYGKQVSAKYQARGKETASEMTLHPLGLIHRDSVAYLVATAFDYEDPRQFPLHRFVDASMLDTKLKAKPGFDIDAYIAEGEAGYKFSDNDIHVELVFEKDAGKGLEETPLSIDQTLKRTEDGSVVVKATLPDTQVLRSWILGFGPKVEVKKPATLRTAVAKAHKEAAARYA